MSVLYNLAIEVLICSSDPAENEGSWDGHKHHAEMESEIRWNGVSQGEENTTLGEKAA